MTALRLRGFTLIELLVTLTLIALFSTLALPMAEITVKRSQELELKVSLRQIRDAIDAYKQAADDGRIEVPVGDSGYPPSLNRLVEGVIDRNSPDRRLIFFLRRIPRDPFAAPGIKPDVSWGKRSSKSPFDQPRAGDDVYDVYSLSKEVGLNGIPYKEW